MEMSDERILIDSCCPPMRSNKINNNNNNNNKEILLNNCVHIDNDNDEDEDDDDDNVFLDTIINENSNNNNKSMCNNNKFSKTSDNIDELGVTTGITIIPSTSDNNNKIKKKINSNNNNKIVTGAIATGSDSNNNNNNNSSSKTTTATSNINNNIFDKNKIIKKNHLTRNIETFDNNNNDNKNNDDGNLLVKCIFLCEFHATAGPKIVVQVPDSFITKELFDTVNRYIIPKAQLQKSFLSVSLLGKKILGYPVRIDNKQYKRNSYHFNICFVFAPQTRTIGYEPVCRKLTEYLLSMELSTRILSEQKNTKQLQRLIRLLSQVRNDINTKGMCMLQEGSSIIPLSVVPYYRETITIYPHQAPVLIDQFHKYVRAQWDLTTLRILPYVDGFSHINRIAAMADVALGLVNDCIKHLVLLGVAIIVPVFQYSNVYRPTPKLSQLAKCKLLQKRCIDKCSKSIRQKPYVRDVFRIFASMAHGATFGELCVRFNPAILNINEKQMVLFGLMEGLIRIVNKYPVTVKRNLFTGNDDDDSTTINELTDIIDTATTTTISTTTVAAAATITTTTTTVAVTGVPVTTIIDKISSTPIIIPTTATALTSSITTINDTIDGGTVITAIVPPMTQPLISLPQTTIPQSSVPASSVLSSQQSPIVTTTTAPQSTNNYKRFSSLPLPRRGGGNTTTLHNNQQQTQNFINLYLTSHHYTGLKSFDEICCATGLSCQQLEAHLARDKHVIVLLK